VLKGFRDFILRGNVVDLAVAVIIGAAFNKIISSLVSDVINPLIASTVGKPNFSYLILYLHGGKITIGNFLNAVIEFLIVASVVYFGIVMPMQWSLSRLKKNDPVAPQTRTCPECLSEIPAAARRCSHCTQPVPEMAPSA
jgi:large conductance mechanosensitive channel